MRRSSLTGMMRVMRTQHPYTVVTQCRWPIQFAGNESMAFVLSHSFFHSFFSLFVLSLFSLRLVIYTSLKVRHFYFFFSVGVVNAILHIHLHQIHNPLNGVQQPAACTPFYAFIKWIYWSNFSLYHLPLMLYCEVSAARTAQFRHGFDADDPISAWFDERVALHLFVALMKSPYWGRCDFGVNLIRHRWHWPLFPYPPSTSCCFVSFHHSTSPEMQAPSIQW